MPPTFHRAFFVLMLGFIALFPARYGLATEAEELRAVLNAARAAICKEPDDSLRRMASRIGPHVSGIAEAPLRDDNELFGWQRTFAVFPFGVLEAVRFTRAGKLDRLSLTFEAAVGDRLLPRLSLLTDRDCDVVDVRRLNYDDAGIAASLDLLDAEFLSAGPSLPLNPPFPSRRDSPATTDNAKPVRIALIDSGIDYRIPELAQRLAREKTGEVAAYDYWDLDPFPFDSDPRRSPFFPLYRGTRVASTVTDEAPDAELLAYRFPQPDVERLAELVAHADARGASILLLTFDDEGYGSWAPFQREVEKRPHLLIVLSAGSGSRNLDRRAVPPVALGLANALVVTAANEAGRLLPGANFGPATVDVAVVAENRPVVDVGGVERVAGGPAIAAARIAALAARFRTADPDITAAALRETILALARPVGDAARATRFGLIGEDELAVEKTDAPSSTPDDDAPLLQLPPSKEP